MFFLQKLCPLFGGIMGNHHVEVHQDLGFISLTSGILSTPCSPGNAGAAQSCARDAGWHLAPQSRGSWGVVTAWIAGVLQPFLLIMHEKNNFL